MSWDICKRISVCNCSLLSE